MCRLWPEVYTVNHTCICRTPHCVLWIEHWINLTQQQGTGTESVKSLRYGDSSALLWCCLRHSLSSLDSLVEGGSYARLWHYIWHSPSSLTSLVKGRMLCLSSLALSLFSILTYDFQQTTLKLFEYIRGTFFASWIGMWYIYFICRIRTWKYIYGAYKQDQEYMRE